MNAQLVDDIREATHLIATKIVRTEKMLCAIGMGKWVLDKSWIIDSINMGTFIGNFK